MFCLKNSRKAFTLVELLVVISIIALLLSILMPSLQKARESANAVVCGNNARQIGLVHNLWMEEHKGYAVSSTLPLNTSKLYGSGNYVGGYSWSETWVREGYLQIKRTENLAVTDEGYKDARRSILRCPSYKGKKVRYDTFVNYGLNYLSLGYDKVKNGRWSVYMIKRDNIPRQGEVIVFGDSQINDNYSGGYVIQPGSTEAWLPVFRHNKSANFIMLDGHVERLRENETYKNVFSIWKANKTLSIYSQFTDR